MKRIYLATPYSAKSEHLKEQRFEFITKLAARFVMDGINCYSPITNSHLLNKYSPELPCDWETWREIDFAYIDSSDELYVACLSGWEESVGVQAEIKYAVSIGKTVVLMPAWLCASYMKGGVSIFM
jgi:hypothetical protein